MTNWGENHSLHAALPAIIRRVTPPDTVQWLLIKRPVKINQGAFRETTLENAGCKKKTKGGPARPNETHMGRQHHTRHKKKKKTREEERKKFGWQWRAYGLARLAEIRWGENTRKMTTCSDCDHQLCLGHSSIPHKKWGEGEAYVGSWRPHAMNSPHSYLTRAWGEIGGVCNGFPWPGGGAILAVCRPVKGTTSRCRQG